MFTIFILYHYTCIIIQRPLQLKEQGQDRDTTISQTKTTEIVHTGTAAWGIQADEKQSFSGVLKDAKDLQISNVQVDPFTLYICTLFTHSLVTLLNCNEFFLYLGGIWHFCSLFMLFPLIE